MEQAETGGLNVMRLFIDLWWFFKQEKKSYSIGIILLVLVSLLSLIPPHAVGAIVDQMASGTLEKDELVLWLLLLLASGGLAYCFRLGWRLLIFGASLRLGRHLRNRLYQHFTLQNPQFYQKERIGDLLAHVTNDVQAVEATAGEGILTLVDSITMGSLVLFIMFFTIHAPLTVLVLIPMPIMALATGYYGKLLHHRFQQAQAAFSELNNQVQENISGQRVIKAFGQEEQEKILFKNQSRQVVAKNIGVARIDALYDPTIAIIVGISFFLAIGFGSWFIIKGELTVGQLTTFTMYLGLLVWPMLAFGWLFNIVERGRASYDRIQRLLSRRPQIGDRTGAVTTKPAGDILFKIQSFTYPDQKRPALKEINFSIRQGELVGITGPTGAGKTTLLRLLMRQFELTDGDILIGEHSIKEYSLSALRQQIGYVPQDHILFSTTIRENIALAKPDASLEEIEEAARIACIDQDILGFELGYETPVGERGVTLSGGQKQRIAIARALLVDPEILILDDCLSAVDAQTEQVILERLLKFRQGKTTLLASHRLRNLELAHTIVVLQGGEVKEMGPHAVLMAQGGWYQTMYRQQQLALEVEKGRVL